jgi:hypothetical protein
MPLRTMARCLRGMASMLASSSGRMALRKVTYRSCSGQSGGASRCDAARDAAHPLRAPARWASASSARGAGHHSAATPPYTAKGRLVRAVAKEQALHVRQGQHAGDPALPRVANRKWVSCRNTSRMMRCQPGAVEEGGLRARHHEGVPGGAPRLSAAERLSMVGMGKFRPARRRRVQEDLVHAAPAEVGQQALQADFHARDVHVVAEARRVDAGHAWLPDVDFPGVEVEDCRLAVFAG